MAESTNFTRKLALNFAMLLLLFIVSLFRGSGKTTSIVGVNKCNPADHVLLTVLIVGGFIAMFIGALIVRKEYVIKKEIGYTFV